MTALHSVLLLALLAAAPLGPGDHTRTLKVGDLERSYLVHMSPKYDHEKSTPVVLIYHGGGSNAEVMVRFSGMNQKSDEAGFIAVYPNGTGRLEKVLTFNGGNCCGYAMRQNVDDVDFTSKLLDDLATVVTIDPKRVFATGMSNGGIIAYRLASELSDRIAAVAPVGGPMGTVTCNPNRPVPVIHFHGTDDEHAPFQGGNGKGVSGSDFYSVEHSINAWVKANGCNEKPVVTKQPPKVNDGTTIIRKTYGGGKEGSEVVLIEIVGGGHTWPGGPSRVRSLGKTTMNISANDAMWEFFEKHPMK
ncbi:MAG: dienelactone hydrolase family protein [Planctomycetia bacterium]|nr:dienelactone hydrolase family protein [Planctomycetia bacterium]